MQKYQILNERTGRVLCKPKKGKGISLSRRYRQAIDGIDSDLEVIETTKGRAEEERDYLNENYQKGWEIKAV